MNNSYLFLKTNLNLQKNKIVSSSVRTKSNFFQPNKTTVHRSSSNRFVQENICLHFQKTLQTISKLIKRAQKPRCFVSYAWGTHEDWVDRFVNYLQEAGIEPHYDKEENMAAGRISDFIIQILKDRQSRIILVGSRLLMTKYRTRTQYHVVQDEIPLIEARFNKNTKDVLPLLLDGASNDALPEFLSGCVFSDFRPFIENEIVAGKQDDYYKIFFRMLRLIYKIEEEHEKVSFEQAVASFYSKIADRVVDVKNDNNRGAQIINSQAQEDTIAVSFGRNGGSAQVEGCRAGGRIIAGTVGSDTDPEVTKKLIEKMFGAR